MKFRGLNLNSTRTKIIGLGVIFLYLMLPMYIFNHMMSMGEVHTSSVPDCPFMTDQSSFCPIEFFAHLDILQKNLLHTPLAFKIILTLFMGLLFFILTYTSPPLVGLLAYFKQRKHKIISDLYQMLFSQGILNSKAY